MHMLASQVVLLVQSHDQQRIKRVNHGRSPPIEMVVVLLRHRRNFICPPRIVLVSLPRSDKGAFHQLLPLLQKLITLWIETLA